jgi:hypothetical protein
MFIITEFTNHSFVRTGIDAPVAYPGILFVVGGGCQQIQFREDDRENGYLGVVDP